MKNNIFFKIKVEYYNKLFINFIIIINKNINL